MKNSIKSRKKIKRFILIPAAFCLTIAIFVVGMYQSSQQVSAHASLPGIETIVQNISPESPFTILEIVPDKSSARFGYLIAGEEPIIDGKDLQDGVTRDEILGVSDTSFSTDLKDEAFSFSPFIEDGRDKYSGGFVNNEWFKRYVFGLESDECAGVNVEVVTLTMSELNSYDISTADLLYFAGGDYDTDDDAAEDLTAEQAAVILENISDHTLPTVFHLTAYASNRNLTNFSSLILNFMAADNTSSILDESVYIYNDISRPFLTGNFHTAYTEEEIANGFTDVLEEITQENLFRKMSGLSANEFLPEEVSDAAVLRYLLNYGTNHTVVKASLKVLDLEPCNGFLEALLSDADKSVMTQEWIAETLASQFMGQLDKIAITPMGTKEFVGELSDPCEQYDMIYIGLNTSTLNTESGSTRYNDSSMNGLIYTHMGDTLSGNLRLGGNDITRNKVNQLKDFIKAGYAVVFASDFYSVSGDIYSVNTDVIDVSSNMYELAEFAIPYIGQNVNTRYNLEISTGTAKEFAKHLSRLNMSLSYENTDLPPAYTGTDGTHQYLQADENGRYYLNYRIRLQDDSPAGNSDTYDCTLYIDYDVDGRYEEQEKISDFVVTADDGSAVPADDSGYRLSAGTTYRIRGEVLTSFTGYLTWKLTFTQNGTQQLVKRSLTGDAAVAVTNRPVIRVLQIYNQDNDLNIKSNELTSLYSLTDYTIDVDRLPVSDYLQLPVSQLSYLSQYDVVVLGFSDAATATPQQCENGMKALRQYALEGRSILFTHASNAYGVNDTSDLRYYVEHFLRDIQGMDRFGQSQTVEWLSFDSLHDNALTDGSSAEETALTGAYLMRMGNGLGETDEVSADSFNMERIENTGVTSHQFGSVSNYPFEMMSDTITATGVYPQNYQLNLDTLWQDDKDDDVTVWYTMSGTEQEHDYFRSVYKDARNHYYIYNRSNVWYSGFIDSGSATQTERELFVNTLIAAYRSGIHVPYAIYKESTWESSADITNMYLPYDPAMKNESGTFIQSNLTVNFKAVNTNFLDNGKIIHAQYYMKADSSSYTLKIGTDYYKQIVPLSMVAVAPDGTQTTVDSTQLINGTMYSMQLSTTDLNLMDSYGIRDGKETQLFIRLSCEPLINGEFETKSSKENFSGLSIICTKLFELE